MITFPAWWDAAAQAKLPYIEDVFIARFSGMIGGLTPVYWIPTDEETQQVIFESSEGYLRIYRTGGETDMEDMRDIHRVQFAAMTDDRDVSCRIVAFVQHVLYAYKDTSYVVMPDASRIPVKFRGETLGPILDPQLIRDARLVPWTVEVETPRPKGLPVVRDHLDL